MFKSTADSWVRLLSKLLWILLLAGNRMTSGSVWAVSLANASAVTFLLYEWLFTIDDEVEYIWSKPSKSWIKWQFLFTRYFALSAQSINRTIGRVILTSSLPLSRKALKCWYISQVVVEILLMSAVETVLMVRVYALYNRSKAVAIGFIVLLLVQLITMVIGVVVTLPGPDFGINSILATSPESFIYYGSAAAVSQCTILILTLIKYRSALRGGWGQIPIVSLMIRDGTAAFLLLFATSTATVVMTITHSKYAPVGYFWFISIVSSAGCRLIINMHHLPEEAPKGDDAEPTVTALFTTFPSCTSGRESRLASSNRRALTPIVH